MELSDRHPEEQLPEYQADAAELAAIAEEMAAVAECADGRRRMLAQLAHLVDQELPGMLAQIMGFAADLTSHDGGDWHDEHDDWTSFGLMVDEQLAKARDHIALATALMRPHLPPTLAKPCMRRSGVRYGVQTEDRLSEDTLETVWHDSLPEARKELAEAALHPDISRFLVYRHEAVTHAKPLPQDWQAPDA